MKNSLWKQTNAVDQLKVIRWSLHGHTENYMAGIIDKEKFCKRLVEHIEQIEQLEPFLSGKEAW